MKSITIPIIFFQELLEDSFTLGYLKCMGVDNWEGCGDVSEDFYVDMDLSVKDMCEKYS